MNDNSMRIMEVDINDVLPNRFQPRIQFDEDEILELSDSIKEHGVIQPIVVRTIGDKYEIIAGERRYKASVLAGRETVPVIVKNLDDKKSAEIALIENVQRKNLTPIEEAVSYKKILDMGYLTQESLALKIGKSQPSVANKIRLLNLSDKVQEALLENKISERHARSLLRLESLTAQNDMLDRIINERLTVRRTDEEINKIKNLPSEEVKIDNQKNEEIEKENINMNNNMFGIPSIPQSNNNTEIESQSQPTSFNIFTPSVSDSITVPSPVAVPSVEVATPAPIGGIQFDANGMVTSSEPAPIGGIQFDANGIVTSSEPTPIGGIQFDANGIVTSSEPAPQKAPAAVPSVEVASPAPIGGIQFDANGIVTSSEPASQEAPVAVPEFKMPEMAPIVESPVPASLDIQQSNEQVLPTSIAPLTEESNVSPVLPEFKMPEPIIVADYNKQYDPVMPNSETQTTPVVDFKQIINAIRECSSKIEQFGYKIDVEEYDLSNLYQVIFKIQK